MLLLENSWIGTGCENYRFKNIPSHKDGTNTGPLLNAPWLPEIWSGSEIQTAAVCGEKDSPPLSGGKGVKLLCIKYVLERALRGLVCKFAWTWKVSFLMPRMGHDELTPAVELLMGVLQPGWIEVTVLPIVQHFSEASCCIQHTTMNEIAWYGSKQVFS